jgi:hypothetical protein
MIKGIKHWKTTVPIQQKIKILNLKIKNHTNVLAQYVHTDQALCACMCFTFYASLRTKGHLKKCGFILREECKVKI